MCHRYLQFWAFWFVSKNFELLFHKIWTNFAFQSNIGILTKFHKLYSKAELTACILTEGISVVFLITGEFTCLRAQTFVSERQGNDPSSRTESIAICNQLLSTLFLNVSKINVFFKRVSQNLWKCYVIMNFNEFPLHSRISESVKWSIHVL